MSAMNANDKLGESSTTNSVNSSSSLSRCCPVCQQPAPTKRCSRCKTTRYCSTACQKLDWQNHKRICKSRPDGHASISHSRRSGSSSTPKRGSVTAAPAKSFTPSVINLERAKRGFTGASVCSTFAADNENGAANFVTDNSVKNFAAVKEFMRFQNEHDLDGAKNQVTDDCVVTFPGGVEMNWKEYTVEFQKLVLSLPDFKFAYQSIEVMADGRMIVVHSMVPSGTHTGKPYAFGNCPPIEATGVSVENDPDQLRFFFRDGKICRQEVHNDGKLTGPAGIYAQLGGIPNLQKFGGLGTSTIS